MITVSEDQLRQVEYLLAQAVQGNHVLFDPARLREAFGQARLGASLHFHGAADASLETSEAYAVEPYIERLILKPTLDEKRAFLEGLEPEVLSQLIRAYFNIVENNLLEGRYGRPEALH